VGQSLPSSHLGTALDVPHRPHRHAPRLEHWDEDYNFAIVAPIREKLVALASPSKPEAYTCTLMQGSGTFSVESMIGSAVPADGKLLVLANGAYGNRLPQIASCLGGREGGWRNQLEIGTKGEQGSMATRSVRASHGGREWRSIASRMECSPSSSDE
jgi:hypothetical protein